jgi:hypothetical protein
VFLPIASCYVCLEDDSTTTYNGTNFSQLISTFQKKIGPIFFNCVKLRVGTIKNDLFVEANIMQIMTNDNKVSSNRQKVRFQISNIIFQKC